MFKLLVLVVVFGAIFYSIRGESGHLKAPTDPNSRRHFTRNGHPKNPCQYVPCPHGTHCVNKETQCRKATCPPIAVCVAQTRYPNFCGMLPERGRCPTVFLGETRWYYNTTLGRCMTFVYSGCGGNENNYLSFMHCERSCVRHEDCYLKQETGPCRAMFVRWYYDIFAGECRQFVYGGCRGNGNNFPTIGACMKKCFVAEFENPNFLVNQN